MGKIEITKGRGAADDPPRLFLSGPRLLYGKT